MSNLANLVKKENIFWQYLIWQFFEVPKGILKAWRNFLKFYLINYFSIPLLIETFFAHWRRYRWFYPKGFDVGQYFEVFFSNFISRILGAVMRSFLIIIGISVEIFIIFIGFFILLGWFLLPVLLIFGLYYGFRILF